MNSVINWRARARATAVITLASVCAAGIVGGCTGHETGSDELNTRSGAGSAVSDGDYADLVLALEAPTEGSVNTDIDFTATIHNNGPDTASGVTFRAIFDTSIVPSANGLFVAARAEGVSCDVTESIVLCTTEPMPAGATRTVTLVAQARALGALAVAGNVLSTALDRAEHNNAAAAQTEIGVGGEVDLSLTGEESPDPVAVGDLLTYSVTLFNAGPEDATPVTYQQLFGGGDPVTLDSATVTGGGTCAPIGATASVACTVPVIEPGQSEIVTITVRPNFVTNDLVAVGNISSPQSDFNENNYFTFNTLVVDATGADLAVTIDDTPDPVLVGEVLTYTVDVTNHGPQTASGASLEFIVHESLVDPVAEGCEIDGQIVTCLWDEIAVDTTKTVTVSATVGATSSEYLLAAAAVTALQGDNRDQNNLDVEETLVIGDAGVDLGVRISDDPDPVLAGTPLEYQVRFFNAGGRAADIPPDGLPAAIGRHILDPRVEFVSQSMEPSLGDSCSWQEATREVVCEFATFDEARVAVLTVIVIPAADPNAVPGASSSSYVLPSSANIGVHDSSSIDGNEDNNIDDEETRVFTCIPDDPCLKGALVMIDTLSWACDYVPDNTATCGAPCFGEGVCVDGVCELSEPVVCDDNPDECSENICNPRTGECEAVDQPDETPCGSNLCLTGSMCIDGTCVEGDPKVCPDNANPCQYTECNPDTGACEAVNQVGSCNDEDPCTDDDHCVDGVCSGDPLDCDDQDPCTSDSCDPQSGQCVNAPSDCDDGNPCTVDSCDPLSGQCVNAPKDCSDLNGECSVYSCNTETGACEPTDDDTKCSDGNECTIESCVEGSCVDEGSVTCEDNPDECSDNVCNPDTGQCEPVDAPDETPCEGSDLCVTGSTCLGGSCVGGAPKVCDLNPNICQSNECNPDTGECEAVNQPGSCNDRNVCTVDDRCIEGVCGGDPRDCDDEDVCTDDTCDPDLAGGCVNTPNTAPCDDGDSCTTDDTCSDTECAGEPVVCDDENPCTDDTCDPAEPELCRFDPNTDPCNDGDECTVNDSCSDTLCEGEPVDCDDENPCTSDSCDSETGQCVNDPVDCDDGDSCTNDSCNPDTGQCEQSPVDCDDQDACTDDQCVGGECVNAPVDCDDDNACTDDQCVDGECDHPPTSCDDDNVCTDDLCDPDSGCYYPPADGPCDDGNKCNDTCGDFGDDVRILWSVINAAGGTYPEGLWIPGFFDNDDEHVVSMTFLSEAYLVWRNDGTASLQGAVEVTGLGGGAGILGQLWFFEAEFVYRGQGPAGEGTGGPKGSDDPNITDEWHYFDLVSGSLVSTTGPPELATFTQRPVGSVYPFQLGFLANQKSSDFGAAVWMDWERFVGGELVGTGYSDIFVDLIEVPCQSDYCDDGECTGGPDIVDCDDGNVCTLDYCDAETGECINEPTVGSCNDGDVCSADDYCVEGQCVAGGETNCDDNDECTNDYCDPEQGGCVNEPIDEPCESPPASGP